jgi:hypothetical protein
MVSQAVVLAISAALSCVRKPVMRSSLNAKALIEQLLPAYASASKKLHSLSWFGDKALPGK